MFGVLVAFHVVICIILVFIILLQGGRGAELGAAFGGVGQAQGGRTPMTGIGKVTTGAAAVFMITSLTLAYLSTESATDSVVKGFVPVPTKTEAPAEPAAEPALPPTPPLQQTDAPPMPPTPPAVPQTDAPPAETAPTPAAAPESEATE